MVSTYSPSLRLELMATGDQSGTWGDTTNTNLGELLEQAITGVLSKAMADTDQTLTNSNGAVDEARNMVVTATGALTAARNVIVPDAEKIYLFRNETTGGFDVTIKTSAGTGVAVPMGEARWVYADGTNVIDGLGLGTAAWQNTGTSGATVPLLNGANVWGAAQTIQISGTPQLILERTGSAINAAMQAITTAGSVYFGNADGTSFAVKNSANVNDTPWLRVAAAGSEFSAPVTIKGSGQNLVLQSPNAGVGPAYARFKDSTGANIGYLGMGGSGNDILSFARNIAGVIDIDALSGGDIRFSCGTETVRINATELLLGQTAGWNPSSTALRGINITKNGQFIASNVSNLAGSFVRMSSNGRVINTYRDTTNVGGATVTTTATSWDTSSDERQKIFIGPYDPLKAIDIIRRDPVRDFYWNHLMGEGEGVYAVGWGAQTSYAISPDLASPGEGEPGEPDFQPWGVDQGKRTPYLWAALTWALDKIDELTARIEALEA